MVLPQLQGLYDPANEHDACGVGFVAHIKNQKSHAIIEQGLKILENLETFAGRSLFTTWANKVALNIGLTELRRKRWRDTSLDGLMQTDEGEFTPSFVADPGPRPEELTERRELMKYVDYLINEELTEKQRTALTATVIQGRPLSEVAYMMNSNQNAVYKLVFDARQRLRRRLAEDNLTPEDILSSFTGD